MDERAFQRGRWKLWKASVPSKHWKIAQMKGGLSWQTESVGKCNVLSISILLHSSGESLSSIVFMCRRVGLNGCGGGRRRGKHTDKRSSKMRFAEKNKLL